MPRTLLKMFVLGIAVSLAGCNGSESTVFPEDGRQQSNPVDNWNDDLLTGRALDGYLQHAFVWLDMDENGQWDEGEPSAETAAGGGFELDVTSLQRDPVVGTDLDPRDYPLLLLAIPGVTVDEDDGQPVEKGFLLMAPPGVTTITPFTTLIEFERRLPGFLLAGSVSEAVTEATRLVKARLSPEVAGFSLQSDYLRGGNQRAAAYGRAITAFLEAQTRDSWSDGLVNGNRDVFNSDLINILGGLTLVQAPDVIGQAKALLDEGGLDNFDTDKLVLPQFGLDSSNPYVIERQRLYVKREFAEGANPEDMTGSRADLVGFGQEDNLSAVLSYFYDSAGRLVRVDVNGWTDPNLEQLRRLIAVRGQVSLLETQYSPGLFVRYSIADSFDEDIDERYLFNWEKSRIEWDTNNPDYGAGVSEPDGTPEQVFTWKLDDDGRVASIERTSISGAVKERLDIEYADGESLAVSQYHFTGSDTVERTWTWGALDSTSCQAINIYEGADTSGEADGQFFDSYSLPGEYEAERLLSVTRTVDYGGAEPTAVEWLNLYFDDEAGPGVLDQRQPEILRERVLRLIGGGSTDCSEESSLNRAVLAVSRYDYSRLSSRLSEQFEAE